MTIALVHGVFDVLHVGHLELLEQAAAMADRVIVSVTADEYVSKGPGRPVNSHNDRARLLARLPFVDEVRINYALHAGGIIDDVKPDYYVKGKEYADPSNDAAGNMAIEEEHVIRHGGVVRFIDTGEFTRSSSSIINRDQPTITKEAAAWVRATKLSWQDVSGWLKKAAKCQLTVAGEVIVDEYEYVIPHGKSPKEPVITWTRDPAYAPERWTGGSYVVMQHARATGIDNYRLIGNLADPVQKRRWVHRPFMHKIFSVAEMPVIKVPPAIEADLLIVADFGHGMFPLKRDDFTAMFKAITVQSNSLNWGMNRINKWQDTRWDYLACDRAELMLAVPDKPDVEEAVIVIAGRLRCKNVLLTLGHEGAVFYNGKHVRVPAFTDRAIDRIGAGDAFLGSTAALVAVGAPVEVVLLIGSCAAALHVQTPGNGVAGKDELYGFVKAVVS